MTMNNANPNKTPHTQPPMSREERERRIAEATARKKRETEEARRAATSPKPGSREARVAEATAPGVVKPSKSDRPTKIPADKNMTSKKTFAGVKDDRDVNVEDDAKAGADAELDEAVKPKKPAKDPNMLSVSDVARELGIDPKRARARLRASGGSAVEGRWPKVLRGSKEHDALVGALSATESREADKADAT